MGHDPQPIFFFFNDLIKKLRREQRTVITF
jgi:hypothetical protein